MKGFTKSTSYILGFVTDFSWGISGLDEIIDQAMRNRFRSTCLDEEPEYPNTFSIEMTPPLPPL